MEWVQNLMIQTSNNKTSIMQNVDCYKTSIIQNSTATKRRKKLCYKMSTTKHQILQNREALSPLEDQR